MALTDRLTAIGDAIRSQTDTAALIPLADMPDKIRTLHKNTKTMTVTLASDIPGGTRGTLVTGDLELALHRNDANLFIAVNAESVPTGVAACLQSFAGNRNYKSGTTNIYGATVRTGGAVGVNYTNYPVSDTTATGVGCTSITASGNLTIFSHASYPIKAGTYHITVSW